LSTTEQWQLILIQKIEAVCDYLSAPERKKMSIFLQSVFAGGLLLWGTFFVPSTILRDSQFARDLVELTASIFPWIDNARENYGNVADKFVYWQCVSVWILMIPVLLGNLAFSEIRLNTNPKGKKFYISALIAIPSGIGLFILTTLLPNCFYSIGRIPKAQAILMLNEYFCAAGAILVATVFDGIFLAMILSMIYLIHFFRNLNQ
jgi:hypothetical protein